MEKENTKNLLKKIQMKRPPLGPWIVLALLSPRFSRAFLSVEQQYKLEVRKQLVLPQTM